MKYYVIYNNEDKLMQVTNEQLESYKLLQEERKQGNLNWYTEELLLDTIVEEFKNELEEIAEAHEIEESEESKTIELEINLKNGMTFIFDCAYYGVSENDGIDPAFSIHDRGKVEFTDIDNLSIYSGDGGFLMIPELKKVIEKVEVKLSW